VKDALLLVDVISDFGHDDGERLLASFRERHAGFVAAIAAARARDIPIIYANDNVGVWDGDAPGQVRRAIEEGRGGDIIAPIAPRPGDRFVVKPRYSAFDQTPLELLLRELEVERILLAGAATEMCVVQTAIAARELGFKVSILVDACATVDEREEAIALDYAENVVRARLERALDDGGESDGNRAGAVVVRPGEGRRVGNVEFLARSRDTPRFNLALITIQPHRDGPDVHAHRAEDDSFYILEGELTFTVDGADVAAGPGTFVFVPPGVPHTFTNRGDRVVRMINVHAPAGFDLRLEKD
jgi:nicotinamidase-related amidase/quercetin dioxygenase-like cupin family protein